MATKYRRVTKKTGPYSRQTITTSSAGTRITNSNKPPGASTRRTSSINLSTGKTRVTHTTKLGGGWYSSSSKSGGTRKARSGGRRRSGKGGGGLGLFWGIVALVFLYLIS